jgi:uncharacterized protein
MDRLIEKFRRKIASVDMRFIRSAVSTIHWDARLVGIKGARGVGKTTLLLQHIKRTYADRLDSVLYVSLDDLWFAEHDLIEMVDTFVKTGGDVLYLDEVHKYPLWSSVIKNIYDDYPKLKIVFTGSSLLEIIDSRADLSRRAVVHTLQGLSFREYLNIRGLGPFSEINLQLIVTEHQSFVSDIVREVKPLKYFQQYLQSGYYPYFLEGIENYTIRLEETVLMVLEAELPYLRNIEVAYVRKLKRLLSIIAESAPFIPNITRMSDRIELNRQTLLAYLHYLEEAKLITSIYKTSRGLGALQKPDKIFLENTNLMYLSKNSKPDRGNLRETFLANQLSFEHELHYAESGDFLVDRRQTIEVGGKNKTGKQIQGLKDAYIAADDIEYGHGRKIPLWLFGFLY